MGHVAAHGAGVGLDADRVEPHPGERARVRAVLRLVALLEAGLVRVEGVGVLHDELAGAQHAGAGARLVALLDLEVVEDERQVAVGAHDLRDVERDRLLVRHREHEWGAFAVVELEQRIDVVAAGSAPELRGLQHGHQHLLPADRVDLLAHDSNDALVHSPSRGHPRPHPRAELANQAGADHELVRGRLCVGGRLLLGRQQVFAEACHLALPRSRTGVERIRTGVNGRCGARGTARGAHRGL